MKKIDSKEEVVEKLKEKSEFVNQIKHKNIVDYFSSEEHGGNYFYVLKHYVMKLIKSKEKTQHFLKRFKLKIKTNLEWVFEKAY